MMFAFIEFKKVNKTQIELIENYKDRVFELCVNQITVIRVSQQKAQEAAVQMIAIYNSIDIPPELNLSSKYHDD